MKTKILFTALALIAAITLANAQESLPRGKRLLNGTGRGPAYIDANNNKICDYYEQGTPGGPRGQRNADFRGRGKGWGQGYGRGQGYGPGQGNCRGKGFGPGQGYGRGQGFGPGRGNGRGQGFGPGRNFVDADKNGICDYYETVIKK